MGRPREMAQLKAALDGALAGHGRLVMLAGEPGTGKTRIAQELAFYAEERGAQVLWGWCYEEEGAPPYWPWVQPIRFYVQHKDAEQFSAEMGPGAADIAEVVPEIRSKLPGLDTPPALEPEQARFRLFDSITVFLKNAAQSQPLMLVLDDLHWADRSSLLLLEFLTKEIANTHLLLVGAYRDTEVSRRHPLSQSLGALIRESTSGGFQRVQLGGFTQQEVREFLAVTTGVALTDDAAEIVHRRTEGNPLFVTEVARQLGPQNPAGDQAWVNAIPEGIRDAIGRRLSRLSEESNQALTTASVIGREFDFKLLTLVTSDIAESRLLEVMDEAVGAYLVEEAPGSIERYRFSHALIQETLSEELTTSRRVRLHARIAEALEELYGADAETHAAELAHHFAEAEQVLGHDQLVRYSLAAGERALASYAHEEALAHFQRALEAKGVPMSGSEPAPDGEVAALLFGLGRAQTALRREFQPQEAVVSLTRAFDYYVEAGDIVGALAVAGSPPPTLVGEPTGMANLVARSLALVPDGSHEAGRLLSVQGRIMGLGESDYDGALEAFDRALAIAQREGDTALEMRTLASAASVDHFHLRGNQAGLKARRAIELASGCDEPNAEISARFVMSVGAGAMVNLEAASQNASAMLAVAQRLRDHNSLVLAYWRNDLVSWRRGDLQAYREFNNRGLAVSPMDSRLLYDRVILEYQEGDFGQGEIYLERLLEVMRLTPPGPTYAYTAAARVIPLAARTTGVIERFEIAEAAAATVLESSSASPTFVNQARAGLALIAVQRGDKVVASQLYGDMQARRGTFTPAVGIVFDHLPGLLSQTMGNLDKAVAHLEDAQAFCRKAGYRPELAWTCCDYADCLLQHASTSSARTESEEDRRKAIPPLEE